MLGRALRLAISQQLTKAQALKNMNATCSLDCQTEGQWLLLG